MIRALLFSLFVLLVTACSSGQIIEQPNNKITLNKQAIDVDIVKLTYQYSSFESSVINWNKLKLSALSQCNQSGYKYADVYSQTPVTCEKTEKNNFCATWKVTISYKCALYDPQSQSAIAMNH